MNTDFSTQSNVHSTLSNPKLNNSKFSSKMKTENVEFNTNDGSILVMDNISKIKDYSMSKNSWDDSKRSAFSNKLGKGPNILDNTTDIFKTNAPGRDEMLNAKK